MSVEPPVPAELSATVPPDVQATLLAVIGRLERRIAELDARLGQDSSKSSRPSSSDPIGVERWPPRRPSGRRPGGQPEHQRHARVMVPLERLTGALKCRPRVCRRCGHPLAGDDPRRMRHQVAELLAVRPEVVEYRHHRLACSECGVATHPVCDR